jgi:V8-like Glu-specific endopeptidase
VGARTVAMMIDSALAKAKEKQGMGKSTVFLKSMVGQAVTKSTRRFKVVSVLLFALLAGAVGGFLALRHFERSEAKAEQERIRQEMAKIMEAQKGASSDEKARLAEKLDQLNRKLAAATPMGGGREIVTKNKRAVLMLAAENTAGAKGFCTGFAVRKRMLATNAHCIIAYQQLQQQGMKLYAVMNQEPTRTFNIIKVVHHPDYHKPQKTISHDVGLVQVDADLGDLVELATTADLQALSAGDIMFTYGFPGRLANPKSPDATLVQGVIGRVTKLDGELGKFEENKLIQHSAFTSGGTSGSPVFTQDGRVIAVNTGGYVEPGSMQVMDPLTGQGRNLVVAKQLAGYNFGIRIDVLQWLLSQAKD